MTTIHKYLLFAFVALAALAACNKVDDLPGYSKGTAPVLSSSAASITPAATDSANPVITYNWTDPKYATDSAHQKFIVELDSAGRNFTKSVKYTVHGATSMSLTGAQLNNALVTWGFQFGTAYDVDARLISSYDNNNEQYTSNTVTVKMTPYTIPFALTASETGTIAINLGNKDNTLESFSWTAPAYTNATLAYTMQYDIAGNNFATAKTIVTTGMSADIKGSDLNKYALESGIAADATGNLEFRVMATVNGVQTVYSNVATISVTPTILVAYLYAPGDYQGWSPSTAAALASLDGKSFEGYVNLTNTNGFKFTNTPDWDHTIYGDGGAGTLKIPGDNIVVPTAGYYWLKANTDDLTYSATLTNWGLIGGATPGGWDNSTPLTYDAASGTWMIASVAMTVGEYKFRANNGWDINYGAGNNPGELKFNTGNIALAEAGNYKVVLNLSNPLKQSYTITKL